MRGCRDWSKVLKIFDRTHHYFHDSFARYFEETGVQEEASLGLLLTALLPGVNILFPAPPSNSIIIPAPPTNLGSA